MESSTKVDLIMAVTANQGLCACGSGEKVLYVCVQTTCPFFKKQPYYCVVCNQSDNFHDHKTKEIAMQGALLKDQWNLIKKDS